MKLAPQTVIELIDAAAERLTQAGVAFGHGTHNAFDEAAWLVLWKLGLALDALDEVIAQSSRIQPVDGLGTVVPAINRASLMATAKE